MSADNEATVARERAPRKVDFGSVTVRKHHMILGAHPGTKSGLPLTIEWEPFATETNPLDVFEYLRRKSKRGKKPSRLSVEYRRDYLYGLGLYSNEELVSVLLECMEIRESRMNNAGEEYKAFFLNDSFFETSAAALAAGGNTLKSVLKSTKAIGDNSVSAALKSSQAAVEAAVTAARTASKATTNAMGASSKVFVKVSAEGAKTIVKVVSSSAERVRRPSIGRSRPPIEVPDAPDEVEPGTDTEARRRRPSLGRINSGGSFASSAEEGDEGSGRRLMLRRRSLGRIKCSDALSAEEVSSEEFRGGVGAVRSRSRVRRVQRLRQEEAGDVLSSTTNGNVDDATKVRRRRSLGRRLKPVENQTRESDKQSILKRSLSIGRRRITLENHPVEPLEGHSSQDLSTPSSSSRSFKDCESAEFEDLTARSLKPDIVAITTAS